LLDIGTSMSQRSPTLPTRTSPGDLQHQAQVDALALSVVDPFKQLLEPLQAFRNELTPAC
jgi:hypothetical protein